MSLRWKGELGDGHIHMTASELFDHNLKEKHEKNRQLLRKIANNPILSNESKEAIRYAVYLIDITEWQQKMITDLREQIKNMKVRKEHESI